MEGELRGFEEAYALSMRYAAKFFAIWGYRNCEDAAQDVAFRLWNWRIYDRLRIFLAVRNRVIDFTRERQHDELTEELVARGDMEEVIEQRETSKEVREVISQLSPVSRKTLEDLLAGLSYKEIAWKYGIPLGTVRSRVGGAFRRFRKEWNDRYGEGESDRQGYH